MTAKLIDGTAAAKVLWDEIARKQTAARHVGLVETFARRLSSEVLRHPLALWVEVDVAKPQALAGACAIVPLRLDKREALQGHGSRNRRAAAGRSGS